MKRLYICRYKDAEWIAGIVATSHKQAKKLFYKNWRSEHGGWSGDCWIDIRIRLSKSDVDVSKLPIGEIEYDWGFKNGIYIEL